MIGHVRTSALAPGSGDVPVRELAVRSKPDVVDLSWLAERLVLIAIGSLSLALRSIARAATVGSPGTSAEVRGDLSPLPNAAAAVIVRSLTLGASVGVGAVRSSVEAGSRLLGTLRSAPVFRRADERVTGVGSADALAASEAAARAFADVLVPRIVGAVAERVDLTRLLLDRADLDRIIDAVDLDAVTAKLPIANLVSRIDVDAVARRVDLEALVGRLDLARIATRVIDEVDLPEVIRESTGELGTEAIDTLRLKTMNADRLLVGWRDRLLTRGGDGHPARPPEGPAR